MSETESASSEQPVTEHRDVVIIGAGLSGISAAYHLQTMSPDRDFCILEGRSALGGTWDLFRYPGVRSDSDMYTLGFSFKPWNDPHAIADGPSILRYLHETVQEFGIDRHIRFNRLVTRASWSSDEQRWTLTIDHGGEVETLTAEFVFMCSGYYSYRGGHTPEFPGRDNFRGEIIHPQEWPEHLDYRDKRVVVIGSGATAVTLVPAMAPDAAHVTMLQRTPTWVVAGPSQDKLANRTRKLLPDAVAYRLTRARKRWFTETVYNRTRTHPEKVREKLLEELAKHLPQDQIDAHFTPTYDPWDQRLCLVPDADLFDALNRGDASVVTDTIANFTETGIQLDSGEHLDADIIVTATGLNLVTIGEMDFDVDGDPVDFAQRWTYKGLAYSDIPNLISVFGYINASWTLRADLVVQYACRILNHLRDTGTTTATPRLRPSDATMTRRPFIDDFPAGYMQRMMPMLPKQGDRAPWLNTQSVSKDKKLIAQAPVDDGVMVFN